MYKRERCHSPHLVPGSKVGAIALHTIPTTISCSSFPPEGVQTAMIIGDFMTGAGVPQCTSQRVSKGFSSFDFPILRDQKGCEGEENHFQL